MEGNNIVDYIYILKYYYNMGYTRQYYNVD